MDCLKAGSWNIEASIDFYYASGMANNNAPSMDGKALETLFALYKGMRRLPLTSCLLVQDTLSVPLQCIR
jgi:hypothetical protein